MKIRTAAPAIAALLAASALAAGAQATELLVNGDFETGDLAPWGVGNQLDGSGSWFANGNGANTPTSGFTTPTNPTGGTTVAITDQGGPGSHTLQQDFDAVAGGTYVLSFDAYYGNTAGVFGEGTDFNTSPNQHFEINLLGPAADTQIFYGGAQTADWIHQTFDISGFITVSGTYTLAFTEVDNQGFFNQGLDNISLDGPGPAGAAPEPASWAMMLVGFAGLGGLMRSRRQAALAA